MYVRFDAEVRPISVALLSRAFGWPEFQGTLAGRIPGLQLRQGVVTLDGNLDAEVFDGRVAVRGLSLAIRSASSRACTRASASRTSISRSSRRRSSSA